MKDSSICFLSGSDHSVFNLTTPDRVANFCDKQPFLGSCKVLNRGYRHEMSNLLVSGGNGMLLHPGQLPKRSWNGFQKNVPRKKTGGGGGGGGNEAYK